MNEKKTAHCLVRDMERTAPYMIEGLYGSFLRNYMDADRAVWTEHLSEFLNRMNSDWSDVSRDMALILWEHFENRITC
jgi:pantothenate kinase type III